MTDKERWHVAASIGEFIDDEPLGVTVGGHRVALYRVAGEFYATSDVCTHEEQLLSEGVLDGCEIECPLHMGRFDVRTGAALTVPVVVDIPTYPVRVSDDRLEVCLPSYPTGS